VSVFNYALFCFVLLGCLVTAKGAAAVVVEPSNLIVPSSSTFEIGAPSVRGVGSLCFAICTRHLERQWDPEAAFFRLDLGSDFGANEAGPQTFNSKVVLLIRSPHNGMPATAGAGTPLKNIFTTVHSVDGSLGIEPWILFVVGKPVSAEVSPPSPAVPLPPALSLFLMALAGLAFLTLRRGGR